MEDVEDVDDSYGGESSLSGIRKQFFLILLISLTTCFLEATSKRRKTEPLQDTCITTPSCSSKYCKQCVKVPNNILRMKGKK